jgi:hypothetical protein
MGARSVRLRDPRAGVTCGGWPPVIGLQPKASSACPIPEPEVPPPGAQTASLRRSERQVGARCARAVRRAQPGPLGGGYFGAVGQIGFGALGGRVLARATP